MQIIDGRSLALKIRQNLKNQTLEKHLAPGLAIILVGNDSASHTYVRLKEQAAKEIGFYFQKFIFPEDVSQAEIIKTIQHINQDPKIHGMIVQLPLPKHINTDQIILAIDPNKDADGFHPENLRRLRENPQAFSPVLCEGIWRLMASTQQKFANKKAVILANSTIFAEPMAITLTKQGLDVTIVYQPFVDFQKTTQMADVVVIAAGQPGFLKAEHVKNGSTLIDVGFNRLNDKVVGDIDFETLKDLPGWITPVPGGVGPMTVAMLMQRIFELASR